MTSSKVATTLPIGVGYGVVVGIGFFFAFLMCGISYLQVSSPQHNWSPLITVHVSEEFNTASRSVKPGLIASGIVSAGTWAATLLQSSTVAYSYGVAGPFWYAAGVTPQMLVFAVLACKVKQNAPRCHTFLEVIQTRYGTKTHWVFICFALLTNILIASQLLLGGSAVVTALTGMNVYAAIFLIPLGVCVYVVLGGLRATFLCDYSHTTILMIVMLYFMFSVYTTNPLIGSPAAMYNLLQEAALKRPVPGNLDGSYVTLRSHMALVFGCIQVCASGGAMFLDQAYWQRAIASRPATAVRAYLLGGIAWFAIPFGFASAMGLAAVALADHPRFPTYPHPMSPSQITAGLTAPFAASALLGQGGALALLIVLFMAVTSCASAELIAVSSILTFDVYKTYMRPTAEPERLIFVSHIMICLFGLTMAVFACFWNAIGIELGWLFLVMGLLIGGAVFPVAFTITWAGQTRIGAICGALGGLLAGVTAWLVTAQKCYGEITIETTGREYPTLAGNLAATVTGLILSVTVSHWRPERFDWEVTRALNSGSGDSPSEDEKRMHGPEKEFENSVKLKGAFQFAWIASALLAFIFYFLIPVPMYLSSYIFQLIHKLILSSRR
ncbi:Sodium:solute symporter family-domain-containing protein [Mycena alexandri]|uniref:Sodium:solute symporter family-domain-containing protein n=1 Tax=Mycena alexandri TaxID=1745969 RepID=A0AAD6SDI0_9AGAR|nr:Sodium:solute symporter family-domain-containing protein [Mycena alexandri]